MPEPTARDFHARMEEPEPGLFRATYRGDTNPENTEAPVLSEGPEVLPDSHIGTDEAAVRTFVEALARNRGFLRVVWHRGQDRA